MLLVANFLEPFVQKGAGVFGADGAAGAVLQVIDVAAKLVQAVHGALGHSGRQHAVEQRTKHALLVLRGKRTQGRERGVADAALGRGDGAQKCRVIVVVDPEAKPGAQVLDFRPVKKAGAARHLVRNVGLAQCLFKRLGLVVGAVQDGEALPLRRRVAGRAQALDAGHGALGFMLLVVGIDHAHGLALAQLAEQGFREQFGVGPDHVVGRTQDGAGGAVVLLQLDDLEVGVVHRQFLEVVQRRAAPAVDGLVIVAHGREVAALAHQQLEQFVLRGVGVLVFVHQHMAQRGLPLGAYFREVAQEAQRHADQVVKVHALVGRQALFIARHQRGDDAFVVVRRLGQRLLRGQAHVLPLADHPLPLARRGHVGGAARGFLQDARYVVSIQDAELGLEAQHMAVLAHHAHAQRVKGADQHILGAFANQVPGALAHFGRGLVREGDGRDAPGVHAFLDHVGDLHGDHPRLAGASPCQDKAGPVGVVNGLELGKIETGRHGGEETGRKRGRETRTGAGRWTPRAWGARRGGVQRKGAMIPAYPRQGRGEGIGHRLNTPGAWRSADRGAPLPMGQALCSGKPR